MVDVYDSKLTKRLVVPEAEKFLFNPMALNNGQNVTLIDYQGGDDMIERVATAGYGAEALGLTQNQLFEHMAAFDSTGPRSESNGFKSTQVKLRVVSSIYNSLRLVHSQNVNVNEESLRYSLPRGIFNIPSPETLMRVNPDLSESDAVKAYKIMRNINGQAFMDYTEMADDAELGSISFARELSRLPLTGQLLTGFYIKTDIKSLGAMIKDAKQRGPDSQSFDELISGFEEIGNALAPNALEAIVSGGKVHEVSMPNSFSDSTKLTERTWDSAETRRLVNDDLEELLFVPRDYSNVGGLQVVDYMGDDSSVAQAARVSYSKGTKKVNEDLGLLRYLYRNRHTSPFEMVELALEGNDPWFSVPRQAGRHRTTDWAVGILGTLIPGNILYNPEGEKMAYQSSDNKQGRKGEVSSAHRERISELLRLNNELSVEGRNALAKMGIDQETIASVSAMGFNNPWYATSDFHNWANMLSLRWHSHAQAEVREMAEAVAEAVGSVAPISMQAFQDYRRNGMNFSQPELLEIVAALRNQEISLYDIVGLELSKVGGMANKREQQELLDKLKRLS